MIVASFPVTALAGETVDGLVWRALGTRLGSVEATLEANPGLASRGPALPEGLVVNVPLPAASAPDVPLVQLWS